MSEDGGTVQFGEASGNTSKDGNGWERRVIMEPSIYSSSNGTRRKQGRQGSPNLRRGSKLSPALAPNPRFKPDLPSIPFAPSERPGLGEDQDEWIGRYVSRVIVEGAGSHSDTRVTKMLFEDRVKHSELDPGSERYVAAVQVHSQKWRISHTLRAVFSADCKGKVIVMNMAQNPVCDRCLGLLKLDVFNKVYNPLHLRT